MKISFFVPGVPAPGGSKKAYVRGGRAVIVDDCKRNRSWKDRVADVAVRSYEGPVLRGLPLEVSLDFVFPRPKSHYKTGKKSHLLRDDAPTYHTNKPDVLKVARSTEDALTGIIWADDCTTSWLMLTKRYGDQPGCKVTVWTKGDS